MVGITLEALIGYITAGLLISCSLVGECYNMLMCLMSGNIILGLVNCSNYSIGYN